MGNLRGGGKHRFLSFFRRFPGLKKFFRTPQQKLGDRCEKYVAEYLRSKKYVVLQRNYESRAGEIDIIAFRRGTIAFVEVRSRRGDAGPGPQESVDFCKQRRIISTARAFGEQMPAAGGDFFLRFDVAAVTCDSKGRPTVLDYYEDAFRDG